MKFFRLKKKENKDPYEEMCELCEDAYIDVLAASVSDENRELIRKDGEMCGSFAEDGAWVPAACPDTDEELSVLFDKMNNFILSCLVACKETAIDNGCYHANLTSGSSPSESSSPKKIGIDKSLFGKKKVAQKSPRELYETMCASAGMVYPMTKLIRMSDRDMERIRRYGETCGNFIGMNGWVAKVCPDDVDEMEDMYNNLTDFTMTCNLILLKTMKRKPAVAADE